MSSSLSNLLISLLWLLGVTCGFSDFIVSLPLHLRDSSSRLFYCEAVYVSLYSEEFTVFLVAAVCFVMMICLYVRIYLHIRRHSAPGECTHDVIQRLNERRSRRALVTTLLILGSFVVCWLPTCAFQVTMLLLVAGGLRLTPHLRLVLLSADKLLYNLLLLNSICDVVIYTLRCKEVRLGYRRLCCCLCARFARRHGDVIPRQASAVTSATHTGSSTSPLNGLRQSCDASRAVTSAQQASEQSTVQMAKLSAEEMKLVAR